MFYLCIRSNKRDKSLDLELAGSSSYLFHALGNASSMTIMDRVLKQKYTFLCERTAIEMSERRKSGTSLDRIEA